MTSCEGRASKPKRINGCKIEDHQDSFSSTMKCKSLQIYFLQSALKHRWPFINFDFDTPTTFYRLFWAVNPVPLSLFFVWDEGKKIPVNETVMCTQWCDIYFYFFSANNWERRYRRMHKAFRKTQLEYDGKSTFKIFHDNLFI